MNRDAANDGNAGRPTSGGAEPTGPPHARPAAEVASELQTSASLGLTSEEAAARLRAHGPNRLDQARRPPYARLAVRQFRDPLVGLLAAAAVVSLVVGEGLEAGVIAAIIVLNAILGFVQEAGAERAVMSLSESVTRTATVIREGGESEILATEVVPGDLLVIHAGEGIAADGRLVDVRGFEVDESVLTGESVPVGKRVEPVPENAPPAERESMVFAGTGATRGRALALVTATGARSEVGRLTELMQGIRRVPTPLQLRLGALARAMGAVGALITIFLGSVLWAQGSDVEEAFLVGVAVAVAAVPEGLAATVTIALALGARAMAARGAIVRRISAVETAGQATVICSDKTGTLTENRLRLADTEPAPGWSTRDLVETAVLASSAGASDPVEAAIAEAAVGHGLSDRGEAALHEVPFDAVRKRMTVVRQRPEGRVAFVKGAPELIFERSLDDSTRPRLEATALEWAAEGLRVIAVARRDLEPETGLNEDEIERELVLVGLVALNDPLRATAAQAVRDARAAGVALKMLTGDHPVTARAVASSLQIEEGDVFARITPADKLHIVEELQEQGEVVAVTGDGVNDAPALRRADVGIAMGRSGSEAAREASDVVLTNDELGTIVAAIREGRRIYDNITKFVAFLLSANLGEVVLFAIAILAGMGAPMTVVQVLVINLLTDGLPAIALARDPELPGHERLLRRRTRALLPARLWGALAVIGVLIGVVAFAAFAVGRGLDGDAVGRTMAFATVGLAELALVFSCRSVLRPAWRVPSNPYLVGGVGASLLILLAVVYLPMHGAFGTAPLNAAQLLLALAFALVPITVVELAKAVARRSSKAPQA